MQTHTTPAEAGEGACGAKSRPTGGSRIPWDASKAGVARKWPWKGQERLSAAAATGVADKSADAEIARQNRAGNGRQDGASSGRARSARGTAAKGQMARKPSKAMNTKIGGQLLYSPADSPMHAR